MNGASNKGNNNHSGNVNVNVTVDAEKNYFDSENRNSVDVVMETADFEVNFALENFMNDENNCATNASHEESFKDARDGNQRVSINSTTSSVAEYAEEKNDADESSGGAKIMHGGSTDDAGSDAQTKRTRRR